MTYINPISGTALAAAAQQEQLSADKSRELRKKEEARRKSVPNADHFEHAVEHADELAPIHEDPRRREQSRDSERNQHEDEPQDNPETAPPPHIDLLG